ncbi:helix-turn-helix transcriptional regulator [Thaumasiovibrio subtropicus]|uniref:helix-turn-helix transcriptional regulator n=1 Tax=Thaumasiovibrio subtropicus TaxID=1891207 RepID=UPI00131E4708|nr:AraC family transcriptional regulator [Thaumasiovibrio subtropicus]
MNTAWKSCLEVGQEVEQRYIGHDEADALKDQGIYLAGIIDAKGHYLRRQQTTDFTLLVYTLEGDGELLSPNGTQPIYEHSLSILPAGEASGLALAGERWQFAWLSLRHQAPWHFLRDLPLSVHGSAHVPTIYHLISALYAECRRDASQHLAHQQCAKLLLASVEASLQNQAQHDMVHVRLIKLFADVERQIQYPWTVEEMASRLHYSVPHFHRLCVKYLGSSPKQYVLKLKMDRARTMLLSRHYSVSQVASFLNYSETSAFSHSFKRYFGCSPAQI